jgi:hypothetical protein
MADPEKRCLQCGDEHATYLMTVQEYDQRQRSPASVRNYWCTACRKESRYPELKADDDRRLLSISRSDVDLPQLGVIGAELVEPADRRVVDLAR